MYASQKMNIDMDKHTTPTATEIQCCTNRLSRTTKTKLAIRQSHYYCINPSSPVRSGVAMNQHLVQ